MSIHAPEISPRTAHTAPLAQAYPDARGLDKFYTRGAVAHRCVRYFETCADIDLETAGITIMEPSAGAGAFLDHLPAGTLAYDLSPEDPRIATQDFLTLKRKEPTIVLGNPPFGKAARLAVKFFNHAAGFATHIGFIVPRTFEKASIQNRLHRGFRLLGQMPLDPASFTFEKRPYEVPCVFQVWGRGPGKRPLIHLPLSHPDFSFVNRTAADFAFQRVGVRAGAVKMEFDSVAATSHHFIRANIPLDILLARFASIDFTEVKARTAGNPSISKTEIVALYARVKIAAEQQQRICREHTLPVRVVTIMHPLARH